MNRKIVILVMTVFVITISFFIIIRYLRIFDTNNTETDNLDNGINNSDYTIIIEKVKTNSPTDSSKIINYYTPTPLPIIEQNSENSNISLFEDTTSSIANITISTDKKTRTFDIMPDVDKYTLKKNIGHLPSSALPGHEGLCVLMGHRDTDFSILQYIKKGDVFTINFKNSNIVYVVTQIEIVSGDKNLRFETMTGTNLVIVTCYPFRYTGNAPKKFKIYAKKQLKNN